MEQWKKIEGYDNYFVSDRGFIRNSRTKSYLEGSKTKQGYTSVALSNKGKVKNFLVHRLVAQAFIPNTENKEIVRHRDGDNENNDVSNLYWQSFEEIRKINGHSAPTIRTYRIEEQ
jgi:hypothetical protein